MAFFRVELGSKNIIARYRCGKQASVVSFRNSIDAVGGFTEITMHEVKTFFIGNILPQRMHTRLCDVIPAHVRYFLRPVSWTEKPHLSSK